MSGNDETKAKDAIPIWYRIRSSKLFQWSVQIAIIGGIFLAISAYQTRDMPASGTPLPELTLEDLDGVEHALSDYRGRKTLLVFWAPWCGVCGAESDNLSRVQSWLGERVHVVSIVLDYRGRSDIERFMAEQDVDYTVLLGNQEVQKAFDVTVFPSLYVVSEEGRIEHTLAGYTTTFGMLWRLMI